MQLLVTQYNSLQSSMPQEWICEVTYVFQVNIICWPCCEGSLPRSMQLWDWKRYLF